MKQYEKPYVMSCGCWSCSACQSTGTDVHAKDKRCYACAGTGKVKLCKVHAQKEGLIKK